jgi:predicted transcriptional regulator
MREQGRTLCEIGVEVGFSHETIRKVLRQALAPIFGGASGRR